MHCEIDTLKALREWADTRRRPIAGVPGNFHASRRKISLIDIKLEYAGPVTIRMKFFRAAP